MGSIHTAAWPTNEELGPQVGVAGREGPTDGESVLEVVAEVLGRVRQEKSKAKRSMRSAVSTLTVADTPTRIAALRSAVDDLRDAGGIETLVTNEADQQEIVVELAEEE
jgi:valyl-tRNA synthetase